MVKTRTHLGVDVLLDLPKDRTGEMIERVINGEKVMAFVPASLPPVPAVTLTTQHFDLLEKANRALGRLDGITALLPDTRLFIYNYVRKEAVLSSQIEGTQSSLSDLLLFESDEVPGVPLSDVRRVYPYTLVQFLGPVTWRSTPSTFLRG